MIEHVRTGWKYKHPHDDRWVTVDENPSLWTTCPVCNGHLTVSPRDGLSGIDADALMECEGECDQNIAFFNQTTFRLRK